MSQIRLSRFGRPLEEEGNIVPVPVVDGRSSPSWLTPRPRLPCTPVLVVVATGEEPAVVALRGPVDFVAPLPLLLLMLSAWVLTGGGSGGGAGRGGGAGGSMVPVRRTGGQV